MKNILLSAAAICAAANPAMAAGRTLVHRNSTTQMLAAVLSTAVTAFSALPAKADWTYHLSTDNYITFRDVTTVRHIGDVATVQLKAVNKGTGSTVYMTYSVNCRNGDFKVGERPWQDGENSPSTTVGADICYMR